MLPYTTEFRKGHWYAEEERPPGLCVAIQAKSRDFLLQSGGAIPSHSMLNIKGGTQCIFWDGNNFKGKKHCSAFSYTNAHLSSFLVPVSNIWPTSPRHISIHQRADGVRPLATVHRQGMVVASQPSSHRPLGTGLGSILSGVSSGSFSSPLSLLLPRWGFGLPQYPVQAWQTLGTSHLCLWTFR